MPAVDFAPITYFPDLLATRSEQLGYRRLSDEDKDSLVPIFGLTHRRGSPDLSDAIQLITGSAADRPFLLDLDHRPVPPPYEARNPADPEAEARRVRAEREVQERYNALLAHLLSVGDGFAAWRELAGRFPNAIPMLQYTDLQAEARNVLRQAALLSRNGGSIGVRIRRGSAAAAPQVISQIIAILDAPNQLLIILDCGQGRIHLSDRAGFARDTIQAILSELDVVQQSKVRAVCMSNSILHPNHDLMRPLPNLDWRIWRSAREVFPFAFGDYAAMSRPAAHSAFVPRDWRATVTYPLPESWLIYRSPNINDPAGWVEGSQAIMNHADFEPPPDAWGVTLIKAAAEGNIEDVESARFWSAAKVNLHLCRQIRYSASQLGEPGGGGDDEDDGGDDDE
jgi:hypothetical protein